MSLTLITSTCLSYLKYSSQKPGSITELRVSETNSLLLSLSSILGHKSKQPITVECTPTNQCDWMAEIQKSENGGGFLKNMEVKGRRTITNSLGCTHLHLKLRNSFISDRLKCSWCYHSTIKAAKATARWC